jgi:prepilin-type N-terminal cleavage/methylation domain-containing protein
MIDKKAVTVGTRWPFERTALGFTLIEVIVSIVIIAALIGMILPAVAASREASRRASCQNNLKQLAIAFQTHHDQHGFFPSGGGEWYTPPTYVNGIPLVGKEQQGGWGFQVLPFIEAQNVWSGGQAASDFDRQLVSIATANSVFFCPTRRAPQTVTYAEPEWQGISYLNSQVATHALCDYAAANEQGTGVVRQYDPVRIALVTDGTASTLLLGDKRLNLNWLGQHPKDDNEGYTAGFDQDTIRRTDLPPAADFRGTDPTGQNLFGSSHPTGINAVFIDGSVHFLRFTIAPQVFGALGNIQDGQIVSGSDY